MLQVRVKEKRKIEKFALMMVLVDILTEKKMADLVVAITDHVVGDSLSGHRSGVVSTCPARIRPFASDKLGIFNNQKKPKLGTSNLPVLIYVEPMM